MTAIVSAPDTGEPLEVLDNQVIIRVPSEATGGAYAVAELRVQGGFRAPPVRHSHDDVDWWAYVLEGNMALEADDEQIRIPAGGYALVPRNTTFRWWNASDDQPLRLLATYSPGGFEHFFRDLAAALAALGRPPVHDDLRRIAPALWGKYRVRATPR